MNRLNRWISKITRPKGLVRLSDQTYWLRCYGIPSFEGDWADRKVLDFDHPYQYQEWSQNWYGKWEPRQSWRGMNAKLHGFI